MFHTVHSFKSPKFSKFSIYHLDTIEITDQVHLTLVWLANLIRKWEFVEEGIGNLYLVHLPSH